MKALCQRWRKMEMSENLCLMIKDLVARSHNYGIDIYLDVLRYVS